MESDGSEYSEEGIRGQYQSENLRGSLLECFKKNKLLAVKRNSRSISSSVSQNAPHPQTHPSLPPLRPIQTPNPHFHSQTSNPYPQTIPSSSSSSSPTNKQNYSLSSNSSIIDYPPTSTLSNKSKPPPHHNLPSHLPIFKNLRKLPLEDIKLNNVEIERPISTKHKHRERQVEKVSTGMQTPTILKSMSTIGVQTEEQPITPTPPLLVERIQELEEQLFILREKHRLQCLSNTRLQSQLSTLLQSHPSLSPSPSPQLTTQTLSTIHNLTSTLSSQHHHYLTTLTSLQSRLSQLQHTLHLITLSIKTKEQNTSEMYKSKLSKYELQNQHLVSQLYLKSEEAQRYWGCLVEVGRFLEKTNVWGRVYQYYKEIEFDFELYN